MIPSPSKEAPAAGRTTTLSEVVAGPVHRETTADQNVDVRVRFSIQGGLRDAYDRSCWQTAYAEHDTLLRIIFHAGIYRKAGGVLDRAVVKKTKFVKKGKLYWTRNPDLTDNTANRIWSFVVDEDGAARVHDKEEDVKDTLFTFDRTLTIPAGSLKKGTNTLFVKASARWFRHTYAGSGSLSGSSRQFDVAIL
ncbi:MAG: hypothetical protein JRN39_00100 [Nitrososphaerota archaeon]|nr:hypothetical protein [Nitrososphaerota archaeon]